MVRWISINVSPEDASPRTKRDILRTAARYGLIQDPSRWFTYTESRNETSHTDDPEKAGRVLAVASGFLKDAKYLYGELEKPND